MFILLFLVCEDKLPFDTAFPDLLPSQIRNKWAVVVTQLAERSLQIPEDPGLNPVIGNFYLTFI